ncbi:hypothetical protein GCM10008171_19640 [Methylopila jiangsuensis]|uniref:Phage tail protein n=1 Tax=Methylopila jiangsuensis TaxID=586230 RepID=A0A9W6JFM2_9HYPH|nr:iron ABC transporter substrate-binding protein [Methylopila jiangsuensis]MDR6286940.1 hypothetical protein [Methylopila jiangsuensis]GLK76710.1 hypothetical protein GCM10008171_19640 [Methylopila jiangsuensis]
MAHLTNKTKFYIATTAATPALDTVAEYEALTWTEIKDVFDLGEFGDVDEAVEVKSVGESRLRRLAGTTDGGTLDLIVNRLPGDAGQAALSAARGKGDYPFKCVLPDKLTAGGDGTTFFFSATVLGGRISFGESDNVVRITHTLAINTDRLEVAAD